MPEYDSTLSTTAAQSNEPSGEIITPLPAGSEEAAALQKRGFLARLGKAELISLGVIVVLLLVGWMGLVHFLYRGQKTTDAADQTAQAKIKKGLTLPLAGEVATITEVTHGWRERKTGDKARPQFTILPYVKVKIDPSSAKVGFVRVWFVNAAGKEAGDIATLKIEGGKFKDTSRGEHIISADEAEIACTVGFESTTQYQAYLASADDRWSLKIEQGVDYAKGPWTTLGVDEISNQKND